MPCSAFVLVNIRKMKQIDDEIIYRALKGQATPEEEQLIAEWYKEDKEKCSQRTDSIHQIIDMAELANMKAGLSSMSVSDKKRAVHKTKMRLSFITAAISAAAVVLAVVSAYLSHRFTYDSIASRMTVIEAPYGEHFTITLPDSSTVHLNSGTTIEYPVIFKKDRREVKLTGEAMFDVTHDADRPFIVKTFSSEIEVLGTKFNVLADKEHDLFSATLLEGCVKVVNLADPEHEDIILHPNDVVQIEKGIITMDRIHDDHDLCWTYGLIQIDGKTFDRLMDDFEKAFGVAIDIQRQNLPDISKVGGKIRINDGIGNALRILQMTADFRFMIEGQNVTIY